MTFASAIGQLQVVCTVVLNTLDVTIILEAPCIVLNDFIVCLNNPSALVNYV